MVIPGGSSHKNPAAVTHPGGQFLISLMFFLKKDVRLSDIDCSDCSQVDFRMRRVHPSALQAFDFYGIKSEGDLRWQTYWLGTVAGME